jgi:hypothetical protein
MITEKIYKPAALLLAAAIIVSGTLLFIKTGLFGVIIMIVFGAALGWLLWYVWGREWADKITFGIYAPPEKLKVPAERYSAIKTAAVRGEPDRAVLELRAILEKNPACREAAVLLADTHKTYRNDPVSAADALRDYFAAEESRCFDDVAPAMRLCDILTDRIGDPGAAAAFLENELKRCGVPTARKALTLRLEGIRGWKTSPRGSPLS